MNSKFKIIFFQFILLITLLSAIEIVLRMKGYYPGDLNPKWLNFKPVDSLYVIHDFLSNSDGVLVADSETFAKQKVYINSDGFRTKQFSEIDSNKKKILFIGDSFTWGMSAKPVQGNCFTDLIRNETSYEVINLGIPAADPVQYFEIAEKYVPQLKPDFVFVMFFAGNDIMEYDRKVVPDEPFYYYTNAGAILADIDGIHFKNAKDAYNYCVNDKYFLRHPKNIMESIIAKSALLSRLYSVRFRLKEKLEYERTIKDTRITKKYLNAIQQICMESKVPVKFVFIPEVKEASLSSNQLLAKYANLLIDDSLKRNWIILQNSRSDFNDYPDGHLNNIGHRKYADQLKTILQNFFNNK